jgi:hypothetical protein
MPTFVLKAKDYFAPRAIRAHIEGLLDEGCFDQAIEEIKALQEVFAWQARHIELVQNPDHKHVSASSDATE